MDLNIDMWDSEAISEKYICQLLIYTQMQCFSSLTFSNTVSWKYLVWINKILPSVKELALFILALLRASSVINFTIFPCATAGDGWVSISQKLSKTRIFLAV